MLEKSIHQMLHELSTRFSDLKGNLECDDLYCDIYQSCSMQIKMLL